MSRVDPSLPLSCPVFAVDALRDSIRLDSIRWRSMLLVCLMRAGLRPFAGRAAEECGPGVPRLSRSLSRSLLAQLQLNSLSSTSLSLSLLITRRRRPRHLPSLARPFANRRRSIRSLAVRTPPRRASSLRRRRPRSESATLAANRTRGLIARGAKKALARSNLAPFFRGGAFFLVRRHGDARVVRVGCGRGAEGTPFIAS